MFYVGFQKSSGAQLDLDTDSLARITRISSL